MSNNLKKIQTQEITEEELNKVWGNANFGTSSRIEVIKYALLKIAIGYYEGYTATQILIELKLIKKYYDHYKLTPRGKVLAWGWFGKWGF